MDGIALARILRSFARRPQIVFVTAYDEHAVDAFELRAVDYLMKPVRADRVAEAVRRLCPAPRRRGRRRRERAGGAGRRHPVRPPLPGALRRGPGRLRPAAHRRREPPGPHVAGRAGAALAATSPRIHRSTLVSLAHVRELRMDDGHCTVASTTSSSSSAAGTPASCGTACCTGAGPHDRRIRITHPADHRRALGPAPPARPGRSTSSPCSASSTWIAAAQPAADGVRRVRRDDRAAARRGRWPSPSGHAGADHGARHPAAVGPGRLRHLSGPGGIGYVAVRLAERNERAFAALMHQR